MSFVYFIAPEALLHRPETDELCRVKIGYTGGQPWARLAQLQTGSPVSLSLFGYIEGSQELERAFHLAFAQLQYSGEWFTCQFKLKDLLSRVSREGIDNALIPRAEFVSALRETIFALPSEFPGQEGLGHREMTDPEYLALHFPEVWK